MLDIEFDKATTVRKSLAIEFTNTQLRLMQLEDKGGRIKVRSFIEVELSEGVVVDYVVQDPHAAGLAIVAALEKAKPHLVNTSYVICLIPQRHTFLTTLSFPMMNKEELYSVLSRRVADVIPMPESEVYWDWHRIGLENTNKISIQLAAVRKELIDSYMRTLEEAKLIPLLFEPNASAAGRLAMHADTAAGKSAILVEAENDYFMISLLKDGEIIFASDVKVQESLGKENVRNLSRKLAEISRYSGQDGTDSEAEVPVILFGNTERVNELLKNLPTFTKQKITRMTYQVNGADQGNGLISEKIDNYIPLIGAAIRGLAKGKQESSLNLVPQTAKDAFGRKELSQMLRTYLTFLAVDIAALIMLALLVSVNINKRVSDVESRYQTILNFSESQRIKNIEQSINDLNATSQEVNTLVSQIYDWSKFFDFLASKTPDSITITNLSVIPLTGERLGEEYWQVVITGIADDRQTVINFSNSLRTDSLLENIVVPLESLEEINNLNFIVEADLPFKALKNEIN